MISYFPRQAGCSNDKIESLSAGYTAQKSGREHGMYQKFFPKKLAKSKVAPMRDKELVLLPPKPVTFQLGITMLTVSSCFFILNGPYFVVWLMNLLNRHGTSNLHLVNHSNAKFNANELEVLTKGLNATQLLSGSGSTSNLNRLHSLIRHVESNHYHNLEQALTVTRTIFHLNYCVNFFLYNLTGAFFRNELRRMFVQLQSKFVTRASVMEEPGLRLCTYNQSSVCPVAAHAHGGVVGSRKFDSCRAVNNNAAASPRQPMPVATAAAINVD